MNGFTRSGATDLSTLRLALDAIGGYSSDLAETGRWHPRNYFPHLSDVAPKREDY